MDAMLAMGNGRRLAVRTRTTATGIPHHRRGGDWWREQKEKGPHDDDDRGVETNITLVSSACLLQMTEIHLMPSFIPSDKYWLCIKNSGCRRYIKIIAIRVTYI